MLKSKRMFGEDLIDINMKARIEEKLLPRATEYSKLHQTVTPDGVTIGNRDPHIPGYTTWLEAPCSREFAPVLLTGCRKPWTSLLECGTEVPAWWAQFQTYKLAGKYLLVVVQRLRCSFERCSRSRINWKVCRNLASSADPREARRENSL